MPKTIISDTSCFIVLSNIGKLELLQKIYGEIITTPEVVLEYESPLPNWVKVQSPTDKYSQKILELQLDKGESSAIALAIEIPESTVILDDYKARKLALNIGIRVTGTIGVIIKAKLCGIIPSVKPYIENMQKAGFYIDEKLVKQICKEAGE